MNNIVLPYLLSMLLGRTIDLRTYNIRGNNIYDADDYVETPATSLNTTYNVIQGNVMPYNMFGIPTDIALKIKSNFLASSSGPLGLDGLLKDTSWKYNSAIVSVTTVYRTVDRTLKKDAALNPDWKERVSSSQTHYANKLMYGGWTVVLFRFKCDVNSDVEPVRKVLTKHLGVVGHLSSDTKGKWDAAIEEIRKDSDIRGKVNVDTHVYSTIPLDYDSISTPEQLMKIITTMPEVVGPLGQPLYMNLEPLHDLDEKYPVVEENSETLSELEKLDAMLDDVKVTKVSLMRWITETDTIFEDEEENRVSTLLKNIDDCIRAFSKVGADISLFKPSDRTTLDAAYQQYLTHLERGAATYNLAFRRLKEEIDAQCQNAFLHKIKGLLRVYDHEERKKGEVKGGLKECMRLCIAESDCRSIGYAENVSEMDLSTGLYLKKFKQCWLYTRSTSTSPVITPNDLSGDMGVYDRHCY